LHTLPVRLSVVIAARNASATLVECLDAICRQRDPSVEIILVDDASTDDTAALAARYPVRLIRLHARRGPAGARNEGAVQATSPILLFVDADTRAAPDTLARAIQVMEDPAVDAVSGSYDDAPQARSVVSQFKNLAHHYYHLRAAGPVTTFFSGCGVIRRDCFLAAGGFDARRFARPSVEDIELGKRLSARGARLRLDPSLQVKHLKRWSLGTLIFTDFVRRAVPWTVLSLEHGSFPGELNASRDQCFAGLIAVTLISSLLATVAWPMAGVILGCAALAAIVVNWPLYALFYRKRGALFAIAGFVLQQIYYLNSALGFAAGVAVYLKRRLLGRAVSDVVADADAHL
jgi:glycosyltransferase involved in cell wall biosynthesis